MGNTQINQAKRFANDIIFISDGKVSEISEARIFSKNLHQ